jgi:ribosomal protein L32
MFIYVIVCSESLKLYVGQHKKDDLKKYLSQKFWDANASKSSGTRSHLYNAMRKYSRHTWSIWPLVSGIESRQELDGLEKHYIRVLKAQHPDVGYNICEGGEGRTGPLSAETRAKLRAAIANRSPEAEMARRQKLSEKMKTVMVGNTNGKGNVGIPRPKSEEFRQRVSKKLKGRKLPPEVYRKSGLARRGLVYNLGNQWNVGRKQSQETIEKRKVSNAGFRHSEETKQRMRHPKSAEGIRNMTRARQDRAQKQTHCKWGHPLVEDNLVKSRLPHRICLTCSRQRGRNHCWTHKEKE